MSRLTPAVGQPMKLKAFRLTDVPIEIRREAASEFQRRAVLGLGPKHGEIPASPVEKMKALDDAQAVFARALRPTDRVYRISQKAWDSMLAKQKKKAAKAR